MLRIVIDGVEAVVDNRTSIDFVKQTQFFWLRESKSFALNHTLPKCPINDEIFEFARKLHKKELSSITKPVQYYWKTLMVFSGVLKLKKSTNLGYEVYSGLDDADFYTLVKDKTLRDYEYGGRYYFTADNYNDWIVELLTNGCNTLFDMYHIFPVENKFLFDISGAVKNNLHMQNNIYVIVWPGPIGPPPNIDAVYPDLTGADFQFPDTLWGIPNVVSPFLKLNWVLKNLFAELGYQITYNFFTLLPELRKMVIYNNRDIAGEFDNTSTSFWMDPFDLLPNIKVEDFIRSLEVGYGVTFWFNSLEKTVEIRPVIFDFENAEVVEFSNLVTEKYEKNNEAASRKLCIKMNVSNMDDIAYPAKMPDPPLAIIEVSSTGAVGSPVAGQVVLVTGDGYYIYKQISKYPVTFGWAKYEPDGNNNACNYFDEYCSGEEDALKLETELSYPMQKNPAILWYYSGVFNKRVSVPHVNCPMVGSKWQNTNDFGFMMMIYEGIAHTNLLGRVPTETEVAADRRYPWGRVDLINAAGNVYTNSTIALLLNNDHQVPGSGIVANFLEGYAKVLGFNTVPVRMWKMLSPEELNKLDLRKKYRIDQGEYFLVSVSVQLNMEKITLAEMDMIKM